MSKRKQEEMTKDDAIIYLKNVISRWVEFGMSHQKFVKAIKIILQEVEKQETNTNKND